MMFGILDGTILWEMLNNRIHPLNEKYSTLWGYLNCMNLTPCPTWWSYDKNIREAALKRVVELNNVYRKIIKENRKYKNFDYDFVELPIKKFISDYLK